MQIIDRYCPLEPGYNPFLTGTAWQVAVLNYAPGESLEQIDKLDVHRLTDEIFVLLEGRAVLIAAQVGPAGIEGYDLEEMRTGVVCNIRRGVWHKIAMSEGSRVLIVENAGTHLDDFEFYPLTEAQRGELCRRVNGCIEPIIR